MNLLDEIRSDLVNESASLANTLRKAKILAYDIGLPEFSEWVEFELNGYQSRENVPEYRQITPVNLGTFVGPGRMTSNVVLPTVNLPDIVREFADNLTFFDGVGELEAQASTESLRRKWPQELIMLSRDSIVMTGGMALIDAEQPIPPHTVVGILDQVKNRLLDFVLGLQENNITSEDLKNRTVAPEIAKNVFHFNIHGDRNIVASGENVTQTVKTVQKGDSESLLSFLRGLNLDNDDIHEIAEAVSVEPVATNGRFGPRVRNWLGGMAEKITSGALAVGSNVTVTMLTKALKDFYDINPQG